MNGEAYWKPLLDVAIALWESVAAAAPSFLAGVVVFALFYVGLVPLRIAFAQVRQRVPENRWPVIDLLQESARYAVLIFGAITALGTVGIDVSALIAGLGLTGFALGFGLRDAISNLLSGVLIILYQPFRVGDRIAVAGSSGAVKAINFRYVILESDAETILVPNSTIFSNTVTVKQRAA